MPVIQILVKEAAIRRGITKPYRLAQRLQGTSGKPSAKYQMLAQSLWRGNHARLTTIDEVAAALGDCELSELLVRTPNKRRRIPAPPNGSGNGRRKKTLKT